MPTISVIVPVYKVEPYIHRCIDSILAQTFADFELILVDDGSPDDCGAICDEYATKDNRIHVIHQANGGLSAARNAGIDWAFANSDSKWITFVDSDDWIHYRTFEVLTDSANKTKLSIIVSEYERTYGKNPVIDETALSASVWETEKFFLEHNVTAIIAVAKLYRKECFKSIRYPVGKIHEDEFTTYKILFEFDKLAVIDQPLYAYYQNPNGIVGGKWNPTRLVAIQAMEERAEYFKKRGNEKMYHKSLISVIWVHMNQIRDLREAGEAYKKEYRMPIIKSAIKKAIAYRKEFALLGYSKVWYPFIAAMFPRLFMLYKKLKGKVKNDNHRFYSHI